MPQAFSSVSMKFLYSFFLSTKWKWTLKKVTALLPWRGLKICGIIEIEYSSSGEKIKIKPNSFILYAVLGLLLQRSIVWMQRLWAFSLTLACQYKASKAGETRGCCVFRCPLTITSATPPPPSFLACIHLRAVEIAPVASSGGPHDRVYRRGLKVAAPDAHSHTY